MFQNVKAFFARKASLEVDKTGQPSSELLRIGVAALLFEVLCSDGKQLHIEVKTLRDALSKAFDLSEEESELIALIASQDPARRRIPEYLEAIREHFSVDQRKEILKLAEKIIFVDGELDMSEAVTRDLLAFQLGLSE
ncbi:MAG: TerB family tellurite resistance protein [Bdellovibrionales bacterium]|nr:TerB family tellurite resistance protein [Bdellovibrionales bacterium]